MSARSDKISLSPDEILSRVLSLLPSKVSASTAILSKRWTNVFKLVPVIDVTWRRNDYQEEAWEENLTRFLDFVDNLVNLQERLLNFSVILDASVDTNRLNQWVTRASERNGLLDISLCTHGVLGQILVLPLGLSSLVNMSIGQELRLQLLDNASHPMLKTVNFDRVNLVGDQEGLTRLLVSSPLLTELTLRGLDWDSWDSSMVSSLSLKKLKLHCIVGDGDIVPTTVAFETPALEFFDYRDYVSRNYGELNFSSLVEARIDLLLRQNVDFALDASAFFQAISDAQILHLSSTTLTVLSSFCQAKPVFGNLGHLTLGIDVDQLWPSLPILVDACPNLQTLVFKEDIHLCALEDDGDLFCINSHFIGECLSQCAIKFLEIIVAENIERVVEMVGVFLFELKSLEQLTIYCEQAGDDLLEKLENYYKASPACIIQVLPVPPEH